MAEQKAVLTLETARFLHDNLAAFYEMVKDGLTKSRREPYEKKLVYLQEQIEKYEGYSARNYYNETLQEIDDGDF